jgi:hypothetical protein
MRRKQIMRHLAITFGVLATLLIGNCVAQAQVPYVTYYQPSTVYYSSPVGSSYVASSPTVTFYSGPSRYSAYYPSTTYYPTTSNYSPGYSYYSSPMVTRYRPLLGRTVSRYVGGYAPTYYAY